MMTGLERQEGKAALLSAPRVHLEMRIRAQARDGDECPSLAERQPILGSAIGACLPAVGDKRAQFLRRRAAAQGRAQINALRRIQA